MSLKHKFKILLKKLGVDIHRYNLIESYEYRIINFFNQRKIDCVLDVGANVGQFATFIRHAGYQNHIVSFEPSIEACKKLLLIAKSDDKWQVISNLALGANEGEVTLNISKNSYSSSLLQILPLHKISSPESTYIGQQITKIERLDSLNSVDLSKYKNFYLKIDTQGFEDKVLDGASNMMNRITGLQVEMSIYPLYQNQMLFRNLYDKILSLGFELWDLQRGFASEVDGKILQVEAIFVKK